jgi:hypothetical protein
MPPSEAVLNRQLDTRAQAISAKVDMADATDERTLRNFCLMAIALVIAPDLQALERKKADGYLVAMAMQILHDRYHLEAGVITQLVETLGQAMTTAILKGEAA